MRLKLYRGTWCAVWREAGGSRRVSLRTKDRGLAEQRLADLTKAPPPANNIDAVFHAYLREREGRSSHQRMKDAWVALGPFWAAYRPDQVTRDLCREYAAKRRRLGRQEGTILKELSVLRAAIYWRNKHSSAEFEMPAAPPPRDRSLTREEFTKLRRAAAQTPHLELFIVLALTTAGRARAILDLTWDRVDLKRRRIHLADAEMQRKRRKGRALVPMNDTAHAALAQAREAATSDWVIEWGGEKVASMKKAFQRAAIRAGLPDVTPHVLRHTAAVWMAEAGVPMTEISQYLGHSSVRVTERVYARFSPDYLLKAAQVLA